MNILNEKPITDLTAEEILGRIQFDLWDYEPREREGLIRRLYQRARSLGVEAEFDRIMVNTFDSELQYGIDKSNMSPDELFMVLDFDSRGKPSNTIYNFLTILRKDPYFYGLRFNELTGKAEQTTSKKHIVWNSADDGRALEYIESQYGLFSEKKFSHAFRVVISERRFHPIRDRIENVIWDGESRISHFLSRYMCCEDTSYTREVSRLIFAGGIHRLYNPGCKFDFMPVLIGTKQGEGKSTIVRWLNMSDDYFNEVNDFEGQKAIEALECGWICEVSELLALTRSKEQEAVKSFLTRQNDRYRMPYDKYVTDHPRQCIFIGTTNKRQFLTDKTANRRFLPVEVFGTGENLFLHENEIKAYIEQCWAEAKRLYDKGELSTQPDFVLKAAIKSKQSEALEDDYRVGMIESYLKDKKETCIIELWQEALHNFGTKPTKKDSTEIGLIMQGMTDWERMNKAKTFKEFGVQRWWKKREFDIIEIEC